MTKKEIKTSVEQFICPNGYHTVGKGKEAEEVKRGRFLDKTKTETLIKVLRRETKKPVDPMRAVITKTLAPKGWEKITQGRTFFVVKKVTKAQVDTLIGELDKL